jgi:hypothetical protein
MKVSIHPKLRRSLKQPRVEQKKKGEREKEKVGCYG